MTLYTYRPAGYSLGFMAIGTIFCNQCGGQNVTTSQFCAHCGAALASALPVSNTATATVPVLGVSGQSQTQYLGTPLAAPNIGAIPARYGGFWIRFVAAVIDGIVVQAVVMPFAFIVGVLVGVVGAVSTTGQGLSMITMTPIIISGTFGLLVSWIYEAAMESSSRQATLGKMAFGMKVTDLQGNRISFARATARHFSKFLSALILFLGYIMAGFTAQKRALHDMIAGTVVRRG
ncbi:MAG: RDD family protein [Terriglobales bacterium]